LCEDFSTFRWINVGDPLIFSQQIEAATHREDRYACFCALFTASLEPASSPHDQVAEVLADAGGGNRSTKADDGLSAARDGIMLLRRR